MNRAVKWLAIIGCMIGYGELRVISAAAAGIGIAIATCALIYTISDINGTRQNVRTVKKRRANDDERG